MLHIVYRSSGGENLHRRPSFYSKDLAFVSLLRALQVVPGPYDIAFLNDGAVPTPRLDAMRARGSVVEISAGTSLRSHLAGLKYALNAGWSDDDVVYFVEDDYLWCPSSIKALIEAAAAIGDADYLACYAKVTDQVRPLREYVVSGTRWVTAQSYTATFATRMRVLRQDAYLLRLAGRCDVLAWDLAAFLACQGRAPYPPKELASDVLGRTPGAPGRRTRARFFLWRLVLCAASLRYRRRPRRLIACVPAQATHMEDEPYIAPDVDWDRTARDALEWGAAQCALDA